MNRKSFFATLVGGLFGGTLLAKSTPTPETKPAEIHTNTLKLSNNKGDVFTLSVSEQGVLEIDKIQSSEPEKPHGLFPYPQIKILIK
jgi:hypothetical protein